MEKRLGLTWEGVLKAAYGDALRDHMSKNQPTWMETTCKTDPFSQPILLSTT